MRKLNFMQQNVGQCVKDRAIRPKPDDRSNKNHVTNPIAMVQVYFTASVTEERDKFYPKKVIKKKLSKNKSRKIYIFIDKVR